MICDDLSLPFHEPVETYSTSPHLYLELDIPENVTGTLPRASRTRAGLDAEEIEDLGGRKEREPRRRAQPAAQPARERPPRTNRNRVRTRAGQSAAGGGTKSEATSAEDVSTPAKTGSSTDPRRRRRRGGRGSGGSDTKSGAAAE